MTAVDKLDAPNHFDQWAEVYDGDVNPLLALEQRTLPPLLPAIAAAHVVDVGCGTGRWLRQLESLHPASLTGTDTSDAMLAVARQKVSAKATLLNCPATDVPASDSSQDLVLASFVLSYIEDLAAFAAVCARVLKPAAYIVVTDMHPVTATDRGWTRSFKHGGRNVEIAAHTHTLTSIVAAFQREGFLRVEQHEPSFAEPERELFVQADKESDYENLRHSPAIYLLKFRKLPPLRLICQRSSIGPDSWASAAISVTKGRIAIAPDPEAYSLDLSAYTVLPGLINAHDHLEFSLFPNLGRARKEKPFRNSPEWANEIHETHANVIETHRQVPLAVRLWFGILRNLLAGVTTVCHHNRLHPELMLSGLPINIVEEMGWAHSLAFDPDLTSRFTATPSSLPFILHGAEGIDESSRNEIYQLDAQNLLAPNTVLVHGLALAGQEVRLLNLRGTGVIFCPTSNHFLFGQSPTNDLIESTCRAALGSDSPITAAGDLLDEITYLGRQNLDPVVLYNLVTTGAANVLHLREGQGTLVPGTPADLVAVRSSRPTPAEVVADLTLEQIELVICKGQVQLASNHLYEALPASLREGLHSIEIGGLERWVSAPLPSLFASSEDVVGKDNVRLGNKEVRYRNSL